MKLEPAWSNSDTSLYFGDCLDVLPTLQAGSAALAFLDLPYGLGVAGWDDKLSGTGAIPLMRDLLCEGGSLYATCSPHILVAMMKLLDVRRIIAWCKPNLPLRKNLNEWEWSTEFVLWETNGKPRCFHKPGGEAARDYWRIHVENGFLRPDKYNHPARKPLHLMMQIVQASTNLGDLVIDPFMGTGTTGVACAKTGRRFIGIENNKGHFDNSVERILKAGLQHRLPGI